MNGGPLDGAMLEVEPFNLLTRPPVCTCPPLHRTRYGRGGCGRGRGGASPYSHSLSRLSHIRPLGLGLDHNPGPHVMTGGTMLTGIRGGHSRRGGDGFGVGGRGGRVIGQVDIAKP